jgi:hypothetical protein
MTENAGGASSALTPGQQVWLAHIHACDAQGCSSVGYARANGLSVGALYAARKDLVRRGAYRSARPGRARPKGASDSPVTLVPVQLRGPVPRPVPTQRAGCVLRVLLPNGLAIEVPEAAAPERCQALVVALWGVSR